jgi:hypothetical protein
MELGFENVNTSLQDLLDNKSFKGCSGLGVSNENLPSFVNMGG